MIFTYCTFHDQKHHNTGYMEWIWKYEFFGKLILVISISVEVFETPQNLAILNSILDLKYDEVCWFSGYTFGWVIEGSPGIWNQALWS